MTSRPQVLGYRLGMPYAEALALAGQSFEVQERGPEDHRGTGRLAGLPATVTWVGQGGALVDLHAELQGASDDQGLTTSAVYQMLSEGLGPATRLEPTSAVWTPPGAEISLDRSEEYAKGSDTPELSYTLRARQLPPGDGPRGDAQNDAERARKQAEEAANAPK
ncbi:MAG: hypothetical protein H6739_28280 [Alphaproteobacteria bacterium]|nr:hypothetical protein [Alphaproteobacteria bacterium]